VLPPKGNLKTNIINYLNCSYYLGYNLDNYFTQKQQITMFERLLSCDKSFKQEWESGMYSIPEESKNSMYLSKFVKKQSLVKKLYRKTIKYISNQKLTNGAQNLLEAYMRTYSTNQNTNANNKMKEIFCGIFTHISERKESYLTKKVPDDVVKEITGYLGGGTKRKNFTKTKLKTRKRKRRNKIIN
jgi:hypothetical protein